MYLYLLLFISFILPTDIFQGRVPLWQFSSKKCDDYFHGDWYWHQPLFVELLSDRSRGVRTNSVRALGRYGIKKHFDPLDELAVRDPIIERFIRAAKKNILNPPKKPKKSGPEKDLEESNKKLEEIRKILK